MAVVFDAEDVLVAIFVGVAGLNVGVEDVVGVSGLGKEVADLGGVPGKGLSSGGVTFVGSFLVPDLEAEDGLLTLVSAARVED